MRLLNKLTMYYLLISVVVFGLGGIVAYNLISEEISSETDYYLDTILDRIDRRLDSWVESDHDITRMNSDRVHIRELTSGVQTEPVFSDTLAMHPYLNTMETMRKLSATREVGGRVFKVEINDVIVEKDDIYESVVKIITRLFALLALFLVIGGAIISRYLMKPFYRTLNRMDAFEVQGNAPMVLPGSNIKEFRQLNQFLARMTGRAQKEYQSLKKFSENASHELQTPLAIANGKLDLLLQDGPLSEAQYKNVSSAQQALNRISKLGKSLSILTKIDNKEFDPSEEIDASDMVLQCVEDFRELFDLKGLDLAVDVAPDVHIKLNRHLGAIMFNNLFHNSIKHNLEGGRVAVSLSTQGFKIENTGHEPTRPRSEMFQRFAKDNGHPDSSGLGLAIVKEICEYHKLDLDYSFEGSHTVSIDF